MKYIITESKLDKVVIKYLNKLYGNLKKHVYEKYPAIMYYNKNKEVYLTHELDSDILWVDYDNIWSDLEDTFGLKYEEIQRIISEWAEKTYGIEGVRPEPNM